MGLWFKLKDLTFGLEELLTPPASLSTIYPAETQLKLKWKKD